MKIQIRKVNEEKGVVQITTTDERWYEKDGVFVPSVTWIAGHYPKGVQFYKWLADIFTTLEHIQGTSDGAALAAVEAPGDGTPGLYEL